MALQTNPYGYITKPFQKESLWTAVESAYNLFSHKNGIEESTIIADGKRNHLIRFQDILYIQADHVYSIIFTIKGEKIIVRKSLQQVLDYCACNYLLYCHRSYIVNLKHIRSWSPDEIILDNSMVFPISKTRRDEILLKLKEFNQ
jgi:two-component system response regulator LytT